MKQTGNLKWCYNDEGVQHQFRELPDMWTEKNVTDIDDAVLLGKTAPEVQASRKAFTDQMQHLKWFLMPSAPEGSWAANVRWGALRDNMHTLVVWQFQRDVQAGEVVAYPYGWAKLADDDLHDEWLTVLHERMNAYNNWENNGSDVQNPPRLHRGLPPETEQSEIDSIRDFVHQKQKTNQVQYANDLVKRLGTQKKRFEDMHPTWVEGQKRIWDKERMAKVQKAKEKYDEQCDELHRFQQELRHYIQVFEERLLSMQKELD